MYCIGMSLFKQGSYEKALPNFVKCLKIQEKVLGKSAMECAVTLNQIGLLFIKRKNYDKALEYLTKCLQIQDKNKGKDSIESAAVLHNIGNIYKLTGKEQLANDFLERSESILKKQ